MSDLRYWLWLAQLGISPRIARRCLRAAGGVKELFLADPRSLASVEGIRAGDVRDLERKDISQAEAIELSCRNMGIGILCRNKDLGIGELHDAVAVVWMLVGDKDFCHLLWFVA